MIRAFLVGLIDLTVGGRGEQCPPLYTNAAIIRWSGVERTSLFGASSTSDSIDRTFLHCHRVTVHRTERTENNTNRSLIPRIQHRIQHGSHTLSKSTKYTNYEIFIWFFYNFDIDKISYRNERSKIILNGEPYNNGSRLRGFTIDLYRASSTNVRPVLSRSRVDN